MSGQEGTVLRRAVKGQEVVDAAHLRLTAEWAEAVVDALVRQERLQVRDVGLVGLRQSEQGAAERELLFALAVDQETVVAHTPQLRGGYARGSGG